MYHCSKHGLQPIDGACRACDREAREGHAKAASGPAARQRRAPKASDPAPVLKPSRAEGQTPTAREMINKALASMPYGSVMQLSYIKDTDSDEKALERMALNLEVITERLRTLSDAFRGMESDLAEHQTIIEGLQLLAKKIGLNAYTVSGGSTLRQGLRLGDLAEEG